MDLANGVVEVGLKLHSAAVLHFAPTKTHLPPSGRTPYGPVPGAEAVDDGCPAGET